MSMLQTFDRLMRPAWEANLANQHADSGESPGESSGEEQASSRGDHTSIDVTWLWENIPEADEELATIGDLVIALATPPLQSDLGRGAERLAFAETWLLQNSAPLDVGEPRSEGPTLTTEGCAADPDGGAPLFLAQCKELSPGFEAKKLAKANHSVDTPKIMAQPEESDGAAPKDNGGNNTQEPVAPAAPDSTAGGDGKESPEVTYQIQGFSNPSGVELTMITVDETLIPVVLLQPSSVFSLHASWILQRAAGSDRKAAAMLESHANRNISRECARHGWNEDEIFVGRCTERGLRDVVAVGRNGERSAMLALAIAVIFHVDPQNVEDLFQELEGMSILSTFDRLMLPAWEANLANQRADSGGSPDESSGEEGASSDDAALPIVDSRATRRSCRNLEDVSPAPKPVRKDSPDPRLCGRGWHDRWPPPVRANSHPVQTSPRDAFARCQAAAASPSFLRNGHAACSSFRS